jgi:glycosyltransferase involved in cell wall biosynthesis
MRLAFLADASLPHTVRWVNHFAGRGDDCVLISLESGTGFKCAFERLRDRPGLPRFLLYSLEIPHVESVLVAFRPDVVNAHFVPNYGWMAARAGAHPLVVTALGSDILTVPSRSFLHRWRTRYVLRQSDAVTSDAKMLSAAIERLGVDASRILTVPLGIEAARFVVLPERATAPVVALSARRLEPLYDVATLVRAYARLAPTERAGMQLRIAGNGSQEQTLHAAAAPLGVTFAGWLDPPAMDRELMGAHIYVSTSLSDSTSVSLLEAMAAGCLPVVSDIPANREWLEPGATGLFFPPGDDAALATCLRRAATDGTLRAAAAVRNRATIRARATWETNMEEVAVLFQRLAAARR